MAVGVTGVVLDLSGQLPTCPEEARKKPLIARWICKQCPHTPNSTTLPTLVCEYVWPRRLEPAIGR